MTDQPAPAPTGAEIAKTPAPPKAAVFLCAFLLIIAADWLIWSHSAGISLAIFALSIAVAVVATSFPGLRTRPVGRAAGILVLALLPAIELVQPLSVLFLAVGLIGFALISTGSLARETHATARIVVAFPLAGLAWFFQDLATTAARFVPMFRTAHGAPAAWGMPVLLGLVFLALFAAANPVIEGWVETLLKLDLAIDEPRRVLFWIAVVLTVWPFLRVTARVWPAGRKHNAEPEAREPRTIPWINQASVTNALLLFNGMFAVQTLLDAFYLWGGATLPVGMTYANYAHRGAYPLVATALMAGAFVIGATTLLHPTLLVRRLIFLWVAQNILLLGSSVLRLNLYVSVYSLTHLRVAAFIWMGLLAAGFALIVARLVLGKSNGWLMTWNAATVTTVLYLCCFVNFADVIARYNVSHSSTMDVYGRLLDNEYICRLGPHALPAIHQYEALNGAAPCTQSGWHAMPVYQAPETWRGWGFRDWRLERYLAARSEARRRVRSSGE